MIVSILILFWILLCPNSRKTKTIKFPKKKFPKNFRKLPRQKERADDCYFEFPWPISLIFDTKVWIIKFLSKKCFQLKRRKKNRHNNKIHFGSLLSSMSFADYRKIFRRTHVQTLKSKNQISSPKIAWFATWPKMAIFCGTIWFLLHTRNWALLALES